MGVFLLVDAAGGRAAVLGRVTRIDRGSVDAVSVDSPALTCQQFSKDFDNSGRI
jgi:hypothetical protein